MLTLEINKNEVERASLVKEASLLVARVKFEPESSSSHESSSSLKKYVLFLNFILSSFSLVLGTFAHNNV